MLVIGKLTKPKKDITLVGGVLEGSPRSSVRVSVTTMASLISGRRRLKGLDVGVTGEAISMVEVVAVTNLVSDEIAEKDEVKPVFYQVLSKLFATKVSGAEVHAGSEGVIKRTIKERVSSLIFNLPEKTKQDGISRRCLKVRSGVEDGPKD